MGLHHTAALYIYVTYIYIYMRVVTCTARQTHPGLGIPDDHSAAAAARRHIATGRTAQDVRDGITHMHNICIML